VPSGGRELNVLITARGRPAMCVPYDGAELTGMAILRWSQQTRVEWHYIAPGKPQQNASARRVAQRDAVRFTHPCARDAGNLEGQLQYHQAAQRARQYGASHLCQTQRSRNATERYATLGLRAPACYTAEPTQLE
jgi:hypothetical protein